jgi:hypothetical protein
VLRNVFASHKTHEIERDCRIVHNEEIHNFHSSNDEICIYQGERGDGSELWTAYKFVVENPERMILFDGLDSSNSHLPELFSQQQGHFLLDSSMFRCSLFHVIHPPRLFPPQDLYIIPTHFHLILTLKMATNMWSETLEQLQHVTWPNPKNRI